MKKKLKNHALPLILLIVIGLIGTKALFKPGFFTSHDGEHQLARQYFFNRALKARHIPPRFDRQLQNNLGYPLFTYTYQFPFWIGEIFLSLGTSIPDAVKYTFVLTFIASAITMYIFVQEKWGKTAGFLSGFLYIWAPYRFLTIFVRASLGEHVALLFIPLILWSFNSIKNTKARVTIGALSIAGLLLSHSMMAQIALVPIVCFWLLRLYQTKRRLQFTKQTLASLFLAVGLSAFYLFPAYYYKSAIQGLNRTFFADHFVTLKQLLYSKWDYGFSVNGPNDGMSFQVGIAQWITFISAVTLVVLKVFKKTTLLVLSFILSFTVAVFFMTESSSEIWRHAVSRWVIIDIPWRFLVVTTISAAILAGIIIKSLKFKVIKIAFFTGLLAVAFYTNRNHLRVNKYITIAPDWFTNYKGTSNSYDEYKPTDTYKSLLLRNNLPAAEVIKGQAEIEILKDLPHKLESKINVTKLATINLNTVYFPGFQLYVDDSNPDIKPNNITSGVPQIVLTPGNHVVKLLYEQTQIMKFANAVSLSSLLLIILLCLKKSQK